MAILALGLAAPATLASTAGIHPTKDRISVSRINNFDDALVCDDEGNGLCESSFQGIPNGNVTTYTYNPNSINQRWDVDYSNVCNGGHVVTDSCPFVNSGLDAKYEGNDIYDIESDNYGGYCDVAQGLEDNTLIEPCSSTGNEYVINGYSFINVHYSTSVSNQAYLTGPPADGEATQLASPWQQTYSQWNIITTSGGPRGGPHVHH